MRPRVYVETTVLSHLTALPTRDLVLAAHQQITVEWWARRDEFELFVSDAVIAEASRGDAAAATRRLAAADGLAVLSATTEAQALAVALLQAPAMPARAAIDAAHVAIATVHGVDYLLTWNCTHIANATTRPKRRRFAGASACSLRSFAHRRSSGLRRMRDARPDHRRGSCHP